ncbi:MAG: sigma-70 family RNA polymerase sigma factor [Acidimicrobiia bacterium]|nr:sigma-70 family RNA polymerase sigma factor [Acidimicrobiia bacterium]
MTQPPPAPASRRRQLDRDTVAAFCSGDLDALARVYDHFSRAVWTVALSVLRDRQLAADATQETFMRAWNTAERFDPDRLIAPWLLTIARRTALDVHRRESQPTYGDHAEDHDVAVDVPGIERAWEVWEVKLALDQLPEEERGVIRLAHLEDLTHTQIAERLDLAVRTVKSRSFRAHKRLSSFLEHLIQSPGVGQ